jgi:hypothetical protein
MSNETDWIKAVIQTTDTLTAEREAHQQTRNLLIDLFWTTRRFQRLGLLGQLTRLRATPEYAELCEVAREVDEFLHPNQQSDDSIES